MPQSTKKKEKKVKVYPAKKLPSLLKKTYTEKKLNKKILKKLYIPADKKYIQELFSETGTNKKGIKTFSIPKESTYTKKDLKRLKKIVKEIKKQKGRFKIVPFAVTLGFIAALIGGVILTKNIIAKKVIQSAVESVAEARCDIKKVDIKILKSTFKLDGFEVADKNAPMKNLFSVSSVTFDFDLIQLLKSRFVANELSVYGVEIGSQRTYDGTLPPRKLKKIQKAKEKENKETQESPVLNELKSKSDNSLATVQKSLEQTFAQYNPDTMFNNFYGNLQTPAIAEKVQKEIADLVNKYENLPAELENNVKEAQNKLNTLSSIDYNKLMENPVEVNSSADISKLMELQKIQDPEELKKPENVAKIAEVINSLGIKKSEDIKKVVEVKPSAQIQTTLNTINESYSYAKDLKAQTENYSKNIQKDAATAQKLSNEAYSVLSADKAYIQTEINKIASFKAQDGMNFISETMNSILCQVLGKYYPYFQKASTYLSNMKDNKKEKKAKKSSSVHRAAGRNIYYKNDTAPGLWIKKIAASGTGFTAEALDVSSNMDITGKPATGNIELSILGLTHSANFIVDTRTNTDNPLVTADYKCNGLPVSLPASYFNNTPGVPAIDNSKVALDLILKVFNAQEFSIDGKSYFTDLKLSAIPFEPEFISTIYSNILNQIPSMKLNFTSEISQSKGLTMEISSDIDKIFMSSLEKEMSNQLNVLKTQAEAQLMDKLNELTNGMFTDMNSFDDIQKKVKASATSIDDVTKQIGNKKSELEKLSQNSINETQQQFVDIIESGKNQVQAEVKQKAADEVKNQLKKFF